MKIYITYSNFGQTTHPNYASDITKENRHWGFDTQEKANKFARDLINGLKERDEIKDTQHESDHELVCETTYGQYVRIYVEDLVIN